MQKLHKDYVKQTFLLLKHFFFHWFILHRFNTYAAIKASVSMLSYRGSQAVFFFFVLSIDMGVKVQLYYMDIMHSGEVWVVAYPIT